MYPITLTNCLKYIARVIYGKRKNAISPSSSYSSFSSSLNDLAQSWGNYRPQNLYRATWIQVVHDPLMQIDNLYLSEGDFVRSGSFRDMRHHFTSQEFDFAYAYFH